MANKYKFRSGCCTYQRPSRSRRNIILTIHNNYVADSTERNRAHLNRVGTRTFLARLQIIFL